MLSCWGETLQQQSDHINKKIETATLLNWQCLVGVSGYKVYRVQRIPSAIQFCPSVTIATAHQQQHYYQIRCASTCVCPVKNLVILTSVWDIPHDGGQSSHQGQHLHPLSCGSCGPLWFSPSGGPPRRSCTTILHTPHKTLWFLHCLHNLCRPCRDQKHFNKSSCKQYWCEHPTTCMLDGAQKTGKDISCCVK